MVSALLLTVALPLLTPSLWMPTGDGYITPVDTQTATTETHGVLNSAQIQILALPIALLMEFHQKIGAMSMESSTTVMTSLLVSSLRMARLVA